MIVGAFKRPSLPDLVTLPQKWERQKCQILYLLSIQILQPYL